MENGARFPILLRLALAVICLLACAQPAMAELALARGVNLSSWFANAPRQPLRDRDFAQIKQAGFDHVRLPVDPERLGFDLNAAVWSEATLAPVDAAIKRAERHGLAVILDIHPRADFMRRLQESETAQTAYLRLWQFLSQHYRAYAPDKLAYGLLNEPQYYGESARYNTFAAKLAVHLRKLEPERTLILSAPRGSSIDGLRELEALDDPHILYDFHFYEPYMVTHQGIHMGFGNTMLRYVRALPYPSELAAHPGYAPDAPDPAQAQTELEAYKHENWNAERIAQRIAQAKSWADAHHAKLICGEFGVLRNHIDAASRYRWIADTRRVLEANGIAWTLWDYTDAFGIVTLEGDTRTDPVDGSIRLTDPARGMRDFEPAALQALGLGNAP